MELELKGKKGSQTAYVDNVGRILSVTGEVAPVAGNDIWLTLDLNLQKGIYHILEKQLAGVLLKTIVNQDEKDIAYIDSSSIKIPIKKAYFQLINNNVLSIDNFASEEASDVEQQIYQKYESSRVRIEQELRGELQSENATPMNALSEEMQAYMQYIYSYLSSSNKAIVQRVRSIRPVTCIRRGRTVRSVCGNTYIMELPTTGSIRRSWTSRAGIRMRTMSSRHCWTTVSAIWNRIRHSRN